MALTLTPTYCIVSISVIIKGNNMYGPLHTGFKPGELGAILAKSIHTEPNEHIVIHHITPKDSHVMVVAERRSPQCISFENIRMTTLSSNVMHSYKHWIVQPTAKQSAQPTTARWFNGVEELTVTVTKNQRQFEDMIKDNMKMKFIGWE